MVAVCPKCRCELPKVGARCQNDGWFGVEAEDLTNGDKILGFPIANKFVALKRVGQGGMGIVYTGHQIGLERVVAIKILSQVQQTNAQITQRFQREAKSIARIVHPNVVQLIDSGIEDNLAFIIMEYVQGRELSSLRPSELSGQLLAHITHQILNALAEAHTRNVIHRDLKPDNIMLTQETDDKYFVKILDFGLAALTDGTKITVSGQALGTPWYMSPEQATASPVTTMTDIYSLGCILYELATSKPPFSGNRPFNVMMQHVNAEVPPIVTRPEVELSAEFIAFIYKCLQKDPYQRYLSALDALDALHKCPEWCAAGQLDPLHSISIVMKQLCEMNDIKSDVMQEIASSSAENKTISKQNLALDDAAISALSTPDASRSGAMHRSSLEQMAAGDASRKIATRSGLTRRTALEQAANEGNASRSGSIQRPTIDALANGSRNQASEPLPSARKTDSSGFDASHSYTDLIIPTPELAGALNLRSSSPNIPAHQVPSNHNQFLYLIIGALGAIVLILVIALIIIFA